MIIQILELHFEVDEDTKNARWLDNDACPFDASQTSFLLYVSVIVVVVISLLVANCNASN